MNNLQQFNHEEERRFAKLVNFVEHTENCILNQFSQGEPRPDGTYWQKFGDKWYQASPIDKTPKCDCGLDKAYEDFKLTSHDARRDEQIRDMVMDEIKRIMLLYKNADFSLDEEIARHILKAVSNLFPENNNKEQ